MVNLEISPLICDFLSFPDLVSFGTKCTRLEQVCKIAIGSSFDAWTKSILLLEDIELAAEKMRDVRLERKYQMWPLLEEIELAARKPNTACREGGHNHLATSHGLISEDPSPAAREKSALDDNCGSSEEEIEVSSEIVEEYPTFRILKNRIYRMALTKSGSELNVYFNLKNSAQGGPIKITGLHFAALYNDIELCQLLLCRGACFQPNICIPNDQDSCNFSLSAANKMNGGDWSQYTWG